MKLPKRRRTPNEASVERTFLKLMKEMQCETRKMNGLGFADWPDRLVFSPFDNDVRTVWVELKRPGGTTSPGQDSRIAWLRERGHEVLVSEDAHAAAIWVSMCFRASK